jgi:hypothetical protein
MKLPRSHAGESADCDRIKRKSMVYSASLALSVAGGEGHHLGVSNNPAYESIPKSVSDNLK